MKQIPKFKEVSKEQADGMGWAFDTKQSAPRPYYFKFPPLQPNQVRIRVLYTSICRADVAMVRHGYFGDSQPIIPGHQVVGRVQALGNETIIRKIGDIVGVGFLKGSCNNCKYCWQGFDQMCCKHKNTWTIYPDVGGFSTHMHVYEDWAFQVPSGISLQSAPPLFCAGITMYNPLETKCNKGDKVAIIGIGGLGHLGIMLGKAMGMEVTAFSRGVDKQKESIQLGAHKYVVSNAQNLKKEEGKYDVAIMTGAVGGKEFQQYLDLLKMSGKICIPAAMQQSPQINFMSLTTMEKEIIGVKSGSKTQVHSMLKICGDHHIHAKCEQFDFMEFPKAYERTQFGNPHFRVLLKVNEDLMKKK